MKARAVCLLVGGLLGLFSCSDQADEEQLPAGFTPEDTAAVTEGPGVFVVDGDRIVTATLADRLLRRQAAGEDNDGPSADPYDDARLEADLGSTYAQGVRVSLSRRPRAFVEFRPLGAQQAQARLRSDGALVSFDEAYPGVTAALGGSARKLKEFLRVPDPEHLPELRYEVRKGPDFGELRAGEAGELWAYDAGGGPLFEVLAPQVKDARGTVVHGAWELGEQGEVTVARVSLNYEGLVYPLLIDPSFDTPTWFFDFYNEPPARAAAAFTWSRSRAAVVMFGGGSGGSFRLLNDTRIRRVKGGTNHWIPGDITGADATKPSPRAYAAMAPHEESGKVYLFGGYTPRLSNELWALTFTGSGTDANWTPITRPPSGAWPSARFMHGMVALSDREILLFGGVDRQGNLLKDTWRWNGSAWTQVCASCFPGLYGFTTVPGRGTQRGTPIVIGGYNDQFLGAAYRWDNATSAWNQVSIGEAPIPTDDTGALTSGASDGTVSPRPRYVGFGFWTPTGSIFYGGGITALGGVETRLSDAWQWVKPGSGDVWRRQTGPSTLWLPGQRESPVAVLAESTDSLTPSFGLLFGGISDEAGTTIQQTRLYRGFDDQVALQVSKTGTDYVLRATTSLNASSGDMSRLGAYFVRRVTSPTGTSWEKLAGCGSATSPLRGSSVAGSSIVVSCSTPISANGQTTAFGVLARDQAFYATPTGSKGSACTVTLSSRATALCGLSSAFPGQALCGLPSGASYECATP